MRRLLTILACVVVVAGVAAFFVTRATGDKPGTAYRVAFDNAFGLTEGVDLRVAGVRAGGVEKLDVQRKTGRALITVRVSEPGFSKFRTDATCSVRPQSLIGEYFMDCQPGSKGREMRENAIIPVDQTETTIPPDMVQNILRKPFRERFGLILNEFGGALAARGPDLNETIRRAVPALTQTDRALKVLADNREEIVALNVASAEVLGELSDRRTDVSRFVREARDSAAASASRRGDLATTIRRLPPFLSELRPTLAALGTVADQQAPALTDLADSADELETFLTRLGPFADASRPAVEALGETAETGTPAVKAARPIVGKLRALTTNAPELSNNLALTLEHLDNRDFAVEKSPGAPGKGYTGLEAILQYPFVQSQAINTFDQRGYILKLLVLANECDGFTNAQTANEDPERTKRCLGGLGPNRPGVNTADPSGAQTQARRRSSASDDDDPRRRSRKDDASDDDSGAGGGGGDDGGSNDGGSGGSGGSGGGSGGGSAPGSSATPAPSNPVDPLNDALDDVVPQAPQVPNVPSVPAPAAPGTDRSVLDFLFGP